RMYIVHEMMSDGIPYNLAAGYYINGDMDIERFRQIIGRLTKRHESFRTSFHMKDGVVYQKVHDTVHDILEVESINVEQINDKMSEFIRPFDLSQAPLIRAKLMPYGTGKSVLVIDMHHIISDQSSIAILMNEIKTLYAGGDLSPL